MTALADLVRRAKEGNEDAFAALYNARVTGLFRYVNSLLRNPTDAEGVTAQTFIEAWKSLRKLRDPERFDAWLFRIGHNLALNERRRRPTTPLESAPEPEDPSPDSEPESFVEGMGEARAVRRALLRLPDAMREVLTLRFFAGLSHAEVAAQIGKSENNASVMQYRALQQMRGLIEAEGVRLS